MTPRIPDWIRNAEVPDYENAHALVPNETRLYGTESLYGDWNGRVLLLAKDFAPSTYVRDQRDRGNERPYQADPFGRTNTSVQQYAERIALSEQPETCGILYGSALACLLRADGKKSGSLPKRSKAIKFGASVLEFVVAHMPRLELVVCLGADAWACAAQTFGIDMQWRQARDQGLVACVEELTCIAAYHPAARVSREKMDKPWEQVYALAGHPRRLSA